MRGELQEGLAELEQALQFNPKHEDAFFCKGMICACLERDAIAIQCIEQALEKELPPVLQAPLYWLEQGRPEMYQAVAMKAPFKRENVCLLSILFIE